jgi:hypothetical protein
MRCFTTKRTKAAKVFVAWQRHHAKDVSQAHAHIGGTLATFGFDRLQRGLCIANAE